MKQQLQNNENQSQWEWKNISEWIDKYIIDNPFCFLVIVGFIGFLVLSSSDVFTSLKFKDEINLAELFWGALIIVAIIERSIELFITAWRSPSRKSIERDILIFQEQTFQSLSKEEKDEINDQRKEIQEVKNAIEEKKKQIISKEASQQQEENDLKHQQEIIKNFPDNTSDEKRNQEQERLNTINEKIETLGQDKEKLEKELKGLESNLQTLNDNYSVTLLANPILNDGSPQSLLANKLKELDKYRAITSKYALYLGLGLGLFASIAGIRILEPLVDLSAFNGTEDAILKSQLNTFLKLDLVVSALAIAGGTKVFHGLPTLISDTLGATRDQINAQRPQ